MYTMYTMYTSMRNHKSSNNPPKIKCLALPGLSMISPNGIQRSTTITLKWLPHNPLIMPDRATVFASRNTGVRKCRRVGGSWGRGGCGGRAGGPGGSRLPRPPWAAACHRSGSTPPGPFSMTRREGGGVPASHLGKAPPTTPVRKLWSGGRRKHPTYARTRISVRNLLIRPESANSHSGLRVLSFYILHSKLWTPGGGGELLEGRR